MIDRLYKLGVFAVLMASAVGFAAVGRGDAPQIAGLCILASVFWMILA